MLGQAKAAGAADWSVLVLDATTTRVMSAACRISEILDYGISRALSPCPLIPTCFPHPYPFKSTMRFNNTTLKYFILS